MGSVLATVTFAHQSGLIEDQVVNNFSFLTVSEPPSAADMDTISGYLSAFYNAVQPTNGSKVANLLGTQLSRAANKAHVRFYNIPIGVMDGSAHGSPIHETFFTLDAAQAGESNLPSEVAVCLSYHADLTDYQQELGVTRPAARRRGRIYLGPLNTLARTVDATTGRVKVSAIAQSTIKDAATALIATGNPNWAIWSRANLLFSEVVGGFVDDAFDTQRRRGEKALARVSFGA